MSSRQRWILAGCALAACVLLGGTVVGLRGTSAVHSGDTAHTPPPGDNAAEARRRFGGVPPRLHDAVKPAAFNPPDNIRSDYRQATVYPPTSRPLTWDRHRDLIEWNQRYEYPKRAQTTPGVDVLLTADRYWAIGDDEVELIFSATRAGHPIRPRSLDLYLVAAAEDVSVPVPMTRRGDVYAVTLQLADLIPNATRTVNVRARAVADLGGDAPEVLRINLGYTPASAEPARFTGTFRDALEDGSLAIYAGVEVTKPGWYNIDANLWDARGEPVAYTRYKGELAQGRREVRLVFFGKVLRDHGSPGPFVLDQLRGALIDPQRDPEHQWMRPLDGAYKTAAHALEAFSPERWHSEKKERLLRGL